MNRIFGYIDKGFLPIDPIYRGFTVFTFELRLYSNCSIITTKYYIFSEGCKEQKLVLMV